MKLTLRPNWRPRPLQSFLGFMDIKTGVTIALLFALLNKVAGVYGLIAVFTGGSLAQLSMYIYSVLALVALTWGLRAVGEEDPKRVLYFAHMFFLDHLFSTGWTIFFGVVWWVYTPHDGQRIANSDAQRAMMNGASDLEGHNMTAAERKEAALGIWNQEKGFAAAVLVTGWLIKIYFAVLVYSFAFHLRKGSYRSLPQTFPNGSANSTSRGYDLVTTNLEDEEFEEDERPGLQSFYTRHTPHSSIASWSDFVSAPRGKKRQSQRSVGSMFKEEPDEIVDEVLFDEDEMRGTGSSGHSKIGTEETTSVSTNGDDEEDTGRWNGLAHK